MLLGEQDTVISGIRYRMNETYVLRVIKVGRLGLLGHPFRIQEVDHCRKLNFLKTERTRHVRNPRLW